MNKSMLVGLVAGIGVATAGGVAGYQMLGQKASMDEQGSNTVIEEQAAEPAQEAPVVVARAEPAPAPKPAAKPASAPRPAPKAAAAPAPKEECWDEEVTVQVDPKDQHQIAGTALGAAVGGAIGSDVGDKKITTAAAAAAGAFIGRKIQQKIQDKNADQRTETRTVRKCGPAGTPHH
jgi:uncharacterized protein YcfJ